MYLVFWLYSASDTKNVRLSGYVFDKETNKPIQNAIIKIENYRYESDNGTSNYSEYLGEDLVITKEQIESALGENSPEGIIIRTLPNPESKKHLNYSNTNPPYLEEAAAIYIREKGIQHLLIDLPSVDKEHDEGKLLAHKAFWNVKDVNQVNEDSRFNCTITEMIYVNEGIQDGS